MTGSIHYAVAETVDRLPLVGVPEPFRPFVAAAMDVGVPADADPNARYFYVRSVCIAWLWLALGCGFGMIALAYVGHLLFGKEGNTAGGGVGLSLGFFCVTGSAYAYWKQILALLARRRAKKHGTSDARYRSLARRATLRNSSLVLQALVGALTFYFVIT